METMNVCGDTEILGQPTFERFRFINGKMKHENVA